MEFITKERGEIKMSERITEFSEEGKEAIKDIIRKAISSERERIKGIILLFKLDLNNKGNLKEQLLEMIDEEIKTE